LFRSWDDFSVGATDAGQEDNDEGRREVAPGVRAGTGGTIGPIRPHLGCYPIPTIGLKKLSAPITGKVAPEIIGPAGQSPGGAPERGPGRGCSFYEIFMIKYYFANSLRS
jgi:hypothetical protein